MARRPLNQAEHVLKDENIMSCVLSETSLILSFNLSVIYSFDDQCKMICGDKVKLIIDEIVCQWLERSPEM